MNALKKPLLPRHNVTTALPEFYCLNYSAVLNESETELYKHEKNIFDSQLRNWIKHNR